jgi:hypothetical protein
MYAYDIRRATPLGRVKQLSLTIDPYDPTIIAFSPVPVPDFRLNAPPRIARGKTIRIALAPEGHSPALHDVFHIEVLGPDGKAVFQYSGNVLAPEGTAEKVLPFALNDPPGRWTIEAKDLLSGKEHTAVIEVL